MLCIVYLRVFLAFVLLFTGTEAMAIPKKRAVSFLGPTLPSEPRVFLVANEKDWTV